MDQRPLEKARLVFKNRAPLPVMFNPSEMTRERFISKARTSPIGRRFSERLSMDLFLDSSFWGNDETDIQPFLQEIEKENGLCTFFWGSFSFSGVLEELTV